MRIKIYATYFFIVDKIKNIVYSFIVSVHYNGHNTEGDDEIFKKGERYVVFNGLSEKHNNFLTIIAVNNDLIYYLFDGESLIQCFSSSSEFAVDLIKLV